MPGSKVAVIGAGTMLAYEATEGTYVDLPNALTIGSTGEQGSFVENTPISATEKIFIDGMLTPPDKEITLSDVPGDTEQEVFLTKAQDRETVNMKVTLANGRIGTYALKLAGKVVNEPEGEGAVTVTVYGKQSGTTTWTMAS